MNVIYKIAEIAKEQGFNEDSFFKIIAVDGEIIHTDIHDRRLCADTFKLHIPTYHQLINWIYKIVYGGGKTKAELVKWLKFWYETLKGSDGEDLFVRRLLKWFEEKQKHLINRHIPTGYYKIYIWIKGKGWTISKFIDENDYILYEQQVILKVFKLLKDIINE